MCNQDKIFLTWNIFIEYVNKPEHFKLDDVYNEIRRKNSFFLLAPRLTIAKLVDILEYNGLANSLPDSMISISELGKTKINEVHSNVVAYW